jgi:hypothetical protein
MFGDSIALARLFATFPMRGLPVENRAFVEEMARSANVSDQIAEETLVLSLLGTRGDSPEWNDRRQSKGHVGIPLVSSRFVDRIPMISRLLKQLGAGLDWIDRKDTDIVSETFGSLSGVFHVKDAASEVDTEGRKIIPAQDFVQASGVKSVIGIGGCYMGTSVFFAIILFLREVVEHLVAERFMLQSNLFKTATLNLVDDGRIFLREGQ